MLCLRAHCNLCSVNSVLKYYKQHLLGKSTKPIACWRVCGQGAPRGVSSALTAVALPANSTSKSRRNPLGAKRLHSGVAVK